MNIQVFNLLSKTNERRYMSGHKTSACKFRLDASVCSDKQRCNSDNIKCECKELIDKGMCDNGFIWNRSMCECEKSCDVGEYLDYVNCKCRKGLIGKLVENVMKILMKMKWFIMLL